nr:transposase [Flavobacterium sp.]
MSEKYKVIDSTAPTFITITVVDWVDLFTRPLYCNILDESLNYCIKEKGLSVHAYVYMTSHIHLIVTALEGELQNMIRDFKKYTSKKLIKAIQEHPEK